MNMGFNKKNFELRVTNILFLIVIFFVVFLLIDLFTLFYNKKDPSEKLNYPEPKIENPSTKSFHEVSIIQNRYNILVMADSHLNKKAFEAVKDIIEKNNIKLLVHLGDHTDFGSTEELLQAKELLDGLGVKYLPLPGDRDLAAFGSSQEFKKIFKLENTNFMYETFLIIDNSPNFTLLDDKSFDYILQKIPRATIIFSSQPIYVEKGNIFESKYMGSPTAFNISNQNTKILMDKYLNQRNEILNRIRNKENLLVISGDHHRSATFKDPLNQSVTYHIVGASSEYINSSGIQVLQSSFQTQRVSIISIDENNDSQIIEIELYK